MRNKGGVLLQGCFLHFLLLLKLYLLIHIVLGSLEIRQLCIGRAAVDGAQLGTGWA